MRTNLSRPVVPAAGMMPFRGSVLMGSRNTERFYYRPEVFGEGGIRSIYGKTGAESIPMLEKAISALGDNVDNSDYWHATEGNAKRALYGLLAFAKMRPDGVWDGD